MHQNKIKTPFGFINFQMDMFGFINCLEHACIYTFFHAAKKTFLHTFQ